MGKENLIFLIDLAMVAEDIKSTKDEPRHSMKLESSKPGIMKKMARGHSKGVW